MTRGREFSDPVRRQLHAAVAAYKGASSDPLSAKAQKALLQALSGDATNESLESFASIVDAYESVKRERSGSPTRRSAVQREGSTSTPPPGSQPAALPRGRDRARRSPNSASADRARVKKAASRSRTPRRAGQSRGTKAAKTIREDRPSSTSSSRSRSNADKADSADGRSGSSVSGGYRRCQGPRDSPSPGAKRGRRERGRSRSRFDLQEASPSKRETKTREHNAAPCSASGRAGPMKGEHVSAESMAQELVRIASGGDAWTQATWKNHVNHEFRCVRGALVTCGFGKHSGKFKISAIMGQVIVASCRSGACYAPLTALSAAFSAHTPRVIVLPLAPTAAFTAVRTGLEIREEVWGYNQSAWRAGLATAHKTAPENSAAKGEFSRAGAGLWVDYARLLDTYRLAGQKENGRWPISPSQDMKNIPAKACLMAVRYKDRDAADGIWFGKEQKGSAPWPCLAPVGRRPQRGKTASSSVAGHG